MPDLSGKEGHPSLSLLLLLLKGRGLVSKAIREARLKERKVCFISNAGTWGVGRADVCPKADFQH